MDWCQEGQISPADEVVISPGVLKPEWADLSKFQYNPSFDIGYMDWIQDGIALTESSWLSENTDVDIFEDMKSAATKRPCLDPPLKDCSNTKSLGPSLKKHRFAAPISSPEREKAARGVVPANTENSTK